MSQVHSQCAPRVPCKRPSCHGGFVPVSGCGETHKLVLEAIQEGLCWMCKCNEQICSRCGGSMFMGWQGPQCSACEGES